MEVSVVMGGVLGNHPWMDVPLTIQLYLHDSGKVQPCGGELCPNFLESHVPYRTMWAP